MLLGPLDMLFLGLLGPMSQLGLKISEITIVRRNRLIVIMYYRR